MPLLELEGASVTYEGVDRSIWAVRDVSLAIDTGEFVGLVGESGCGKSTLALAMTRLLKPQARLTSGRIRFRGIDVTSLSGEELRRQRVRGFALVPQSGMNTLNPVLRVEEHFVDVLGSHERLRKAEARERALALLERVDLPGGVLRRYPHQLSGGMRQRVAIALVLTLQPSFVVFDEPTTALDVITQYRVLETIRSLQREEGFAAIVVSHDLGLVLDFCDRVLVMYAGRIVENQASQGLLSEPKHPYTEALLRCYADPRSEEVKLATIPGTPPDLSQSLEDACPFAPRCPKAEAICVSDRPRLLDLGTAHAACFVAEREAQERAHVG